MVAGNWKMNATRSEANTLLGAIKSAASAYSAIDITLLPSFVYIPLAQSLLDNSAVSWGAQNIYPGKSGAFTGEISGDMLAEYGCQYVLVGHSERRHIFQESLQLTAAKFHAALDAGLKPILCLGETLAEREKNMTEEVISRQLKSVITNSSIEAFRLAVIAYEPVWAIGTGKTATPQQAQTVHNFIRTLLAKHDVSIAKASRILYGGSVKADNAAGLFAMPDIDGALVGGASLDAKSFLSICQASAETADRPEKSTKGV
jgi:triosephosphate isomerase